jgi:protein SCO1
LAVTAWLLVTGCAAPEKLPGTDLGGQPAAPFRLTDHAGRSLALDDLRGRPVALTFLYTSCPDLCPLTAQRLGQSLAKLGPDGERVAVVVISVDPANDTPEAARAFLQRHDLAGLNRHFLLGDDATLAPVWLAYGIAAGPTWADRPYRRRLLD